MPTTIKFAPPPNLFQLEVAGKIFTKREVDVVACIVNGRPVKKIASLLAISDKTVETHLRNIGLKLGRSTQASIIEFIEKTDKYLFFKQYYIQLLIQHLFESALKSLANKPTTTELSLNLTLNEPLSPEYAWLLKSLTTDLRLAQIKVVVNVYQEQGNSRLVIFEQGRELACLYLNDYQNYYFLVFAIIAVLWPGDKVQASCAKFTNEYSALMKNMAVEPPVLPRASTNPHTINHTTVSFYKLQFFFKQNYLSAIKICIIGLLVLASMYYTHKNVNPIKIHSSNNSNILNELQKGQTMAWNLPRQDQKFIGRKNLLQMLQTKLHPKNQSNKQINAVRVCAGLGGIGKTQLALQYAAHTNYPYTLKAWFLSENLDQLKQQYIELALLLGYRDNEVSFEKASLYLKNWLVNNPGWLLIYDNVENYTQIKDFLPAKGGWTIITTRQQNWPNTFDKLDIDVMLKGEAIELLQSLLDPTINWQQDELKELVKNLGYLPLAIAQAGAYIQQNMISIEQYLKLYKVYQEQFMQDDSLPSGASTQPIATTWNVTLQAIIKDANIKQQKPLALELLTACAYLAPEKISQELLLVWLKKAHPELSNPQWVLPKLVAKLREYSMITQDDDGSVIIHRLVQAILRHNHQLDDNNHFNKPSKQWFNALIQAMHKQFTLKTNPLDDEKRQRALLPHMQSLVEHYIKILPSEAELSLAPIFNNLGILFLDANDCQTARHYHERALKSLEQHYKSNHLDIAITRDYLGNVYRNLGLEHESKELHAKALETMQKHYGKNHIETADVLDHLARSYRMLGNTKQAIVLHHKALEIKEEHYGKDHLQVALILDQLGRDYKNIRQVEPSRKALERSLAIKEKYYGPNHVEVAFTSDFLGRTFRYLGDVKQAKIVHERAAKLVEEFYGPESISTIYVIDQLARDLRYLGFLEQARDLHLRALKVKEQHYGKDHIDTSYTSDWLARVYRMLGEFDKAKEIHSKNLEIRRAYYGDDHIARAYISDQLARDYRQAGELDKAIELHTYALKAMVKEYGKSNLTVALIHEQLAKDYYLKNEIAQAKQLQEYALKMKLQHYGSEHIESAISYSNWGMMLVKDHQLEEGVKYLEKALKIKTQYYGENNIYLVDTLHALSEAMQTIGNLKQAKLYLKQANACALPR